MVGKLINVIKRSENRSLVNFRRLRLNDFDALLISHPSGKFLFDVASSESYRLESSDADVVEKFADSDQNAAILETSPFVSDLIERGKLFSSDANRKNHRTSERLRLQDVVVQIAYACNLKCTYCYADEGLYGGGESLMMTREMAEHVINFSFEHRGSSSLGFAILGGEPLMNRDCLTHLIEYAAKKGEDEGVEVEFSITTNGIGLNQEMIDFFERYRVGVRLSMDGTKDIHDTYRLDRKGGGTFDVVNDKYGKMLKESRVDFQVRASFFGEHGDRLVDQARTMVESLGYDSIKMDFIWGVDGTIGEVTDENLQLTLNGIDHLSQWFSGRVLDENYDWRNFNPYSKYMGRLVQKPVATNLYSEDAKGELVAGGSILENSGVECGAGVNVISISATGDIFTCHRTEGNDAFKMGNVTTGIDEAFLKYWGNKWRLADDEADCSKCWARFVCLGGCPAFGVYKHGDPMKNDRIRCQLRRQFIASSIVLTHELKERGLVS